ncbi:hypothetical protein CTI12_AA441740 [Artemisia annua]|uniref:Uncharacterized protein n=1 Tax=Artemisia annua TaxID=35608 RepID=A0A2U1LSC8_ARTAN|nr:hypothetical protein CTI12_AA441740 [Artemisia annua]
MEKKHNKMERKHNNLKQKVDYLMKHLPHLSEWQSQHVWLFSINLVQWLIYLKTKTNTVQKSKDGKAENSFLYNCGRSKPSQLNRSISDHRNHRRSPSPSLITITSPITVTVADHCNHLRSPTLITVTISDHHHRRRKL